MPRCYFKSGVGYKLLLAAGKVTSLTKNNGPKNPWGKDIEQIYFTSNFIGKTLNVKIYVPDRYEPPIDLPRKESTSSDELELSTFDRYDPFYFTVTRKSTQVKLFDTSLGGLIFSDKFLQIVTKLPSQAMYGWGENVHPTLKHNFTRYTTWAMFARDEPPNSQHLQTKNLYGASLCGENAGVFVSESLRILYSENCCVGVHPFYMVVEPDGNSHGVLILNSNAQVNSHWFAKRWITG
ncbi:unnamed protein product [Strongylus vulgaris]|uniref:Uncharacterized protein n=1 Tax=Strongylus vulgaris TaxID=40348 RepID=A0A3P7JUS1_STRVU|nr:unnamed protein product [Strongylus vulgaris]